MNDPSAGRLTSLVPSASVSLTVKWKEVGVHED